TYTLCMSILVGKLVITMIDEWIELIQAILVSVAITPLFTSYSHDKMSTFQGIFHSSFIIISLLISRNTVIPHILLAAGIDSESSSIFISVLLMSISISLTPLPYH